MKAKELLDSLEKWTKGTSARDKYGYACETDSPDAVKFCLSGALEKCYRDVSSKDLYKARIKLKQAIASIGVHAGIMSFNDDLGTTFEDIKAVLVLADV